MLVKGNKQGFTLIEVVIVLAIAALVLAGVFLAVNGAQTSRRDTQRKNDVGRVASYLEQWSSNNNGNYPADQTAFGTAMATYMNGMNDPRTGTAYTRAALVVPTATTPAGLSYTLTNRVYTVCIGLEQGGSACRTNN